MLICITILRKLRCRCHIIPFSSLLHLIFQSFLFRILQQNSTDQHFQNQPPLCSTAGFVTYKIKKKCIELHVHNTGTLRGRKQVNMNIIKPFKITTQWWIQWRSPGGPTPTPPLILGKKRRNDRREESQQRKYNNPQPHPP